MNELPLIFTFLFNKSISAGWFILAVVFIRLCFKDLPKKTICVLWGLVLLRLIVPFLPQSSLSLIPSQETISMRTIQYAPQPTIDSGIEIIDETVNPVFSQTFAPEPVASVNPLYVYVSIASIVWITVMVGMLGYALFKVFHLRRKLQESLVYGEHVRISDSVTSPFILGIFRPVIYLPSTIGYENMSTVLAHEEVHIKRKDHWVKPLAYLVLCVYWFHPLIWVFWYLFGKDIEMACDESVIKNKDMQERKKYAETLLVFGTQKNRSITCPLAFSEDNVKQRVKNVLQYKGSTRLISGLSIVVCTMAVLLFMTDKSRSLPIQADGMRSLTITDVESDKGSTLTSAQTQELNAYLRHLNVKKTTVEGTEKWVIHWENNSGERKELQISENGEILFEGKWYEADTVNASYLTYLVMQSEMNEAYYIDESQYESAELIRMNAEVYTVDLPQTVRLAAASDAVEIPVSKTKSEGTLRLNGDTTETIDVLLYDGSYYLQWHGNVFLPNQQAVAQILAVSEETDNAIINGCSVLVDSGEYYNIVLELHGNGHDYRILNTTDLMRLMDDYMTENNEEIVLKEPVNYCVTAPSTTSYRMFEELPVEHTYEAQLRSVLEKFPFEIEIRTPDEKVVRRTVYLKYMHDTEN